VRDSGLLCLWLAVAACAAPPRPAPAPATDRPRAPIVATERGPRGGRLVWIDEGGRRVAELTPIETVAVRDVSASWSPDGRWIAFESTRGRAGLEETSIWIIAARTGARPHRLTTGQGTDAHPTWTPDGRSIVCASIGKSADNFDLWRLDLDLSGDVPRLAERVRLTDTPENEMHPSVSPDGRTIVYQRATDADGSAIWSMPAGGGAGRAITDGPADLTPSLSPNGEVIAFVRGRTVTLPKGGTRIDTDLFLIPAAGGDSQLVVPNPFADEHGPRWSASGRYLFATTLYRAAETDAAVLGSVTFVDLTEKPRTLRALHDPAAVTTRTSPALGGTELDPGRLAGHEPYPKALFRFLSDLQRRRDDAAGAAATPP
jgi:Tol biopolymer transport system component